MLVLTYVLAALVAAEFLFIMYIETFATSSDLTAKVFGMDRGELERPSVVMLFKNQGVYNGLLAVLVVAALVARSLPALACLMGYVVLVAAYGAASTRNPQIFFKQAGVAVLCLVACLVTMAL